MVKPRRAALVFLVLAALLAVAWFSRARWLADLLAALGGNAALITIIVAILGLLVAAGAAVVQWSGQRRPPPQPPGRLVQPVALDALRAQFRDLEKQTFAYVDRGALNRQLMFPSRLVITGDPKVGKTREAVELIGRVLEPRHIPPARIFRPTTELRGTDTNAVTGQIRKDVGDHGPLLLFVDDLPRFFQMNELDRLAAALNELKNCGDLHVVATARDGQLTAGHRDWLSAHDFRAIPLSRWGADDVARLVDDGLYLVELPDDSEGRQALVDGNDGTPELTRLTLLALAGLGRSDRQTVEETQRDTYLDMWRATREELSARQPAVRPLLWAAAVFYAARVTPYTTLVMALAARRTTGMRPARRLREALRLLEGYGLGQEDGRLRMRDYVAEVEASDEADARRVLADFLLRYRRWLRFPGLRRLYPTREQHADALFDLALTSDDKTEAESVVRYYTAAIGFRPFSWYYNNRGVLHNDHSRPDEALADYSAAIRLDPTYAAAFNNRGSLHAKHGRPDEALADYSEAIRLDPTLAQAFNNRGALHDDHGRPAEALADYNEAIRLDPGDATAFYNRGNLHRQQGRPAEGLADYNEAIRLDPALAQAFNNRGNLHRQQGRPAEALADYNEAIRLDPALVQAFNSRGLLHAGHGRPDEALADYGEAIRLDPTDATAFYNRGNLLRQLGRMEEAITDLETRARLGPDTAGLHVDLAGAYRDLGRAGDAARHVALARECLPEDDLYNRACLEAIAGNDNLALDLLAQALAAGQVDREWVRRDPDWKPLRDHPRFRELTGEP
ncbi:MAG: tetratricopeptide repeat protein [Anaerolineae bacterium]|nr:tetratricopeptide repeat protein [Anaerolineae bacterium]